MTYKLWLDDQLDDPETPNRWTPEDFVGASSVQQAIEIVKEKGVPEFIDFDHDLGDGTAMDFLYWLAYTFQASPIFDYNIHSENPIGRKNIEAFMNSWNRSQ